MIRINWSYALNLAEHQKLPLMDSHPPIPLEVYGWSHSQACCISYTCPCPIALEGCRKSRLWQGCPPWRFRGSHRWPSHMVSQDGRLCKTNGKPRRTVDFQALSAHATRDTHHTMSPFLQARSVPVDKKKTVFDAWNGYHSVPIWRRLSSNNIMGEVPLKDGLTRLHRLGRRLHLALRRDCRNP